MSLEVVSINGRIFSPSEAKISVFDRGFLYGDSVYEVARSYGRVFFALEDHIERLFNSARLIGLNIGRTPDEIISDIYKVYEESELNDAYMRIVVTRGEGPITLDPEKSTSPNVVIFVRPLDLPAPSMYERGVDIITASVFRNPKKSLDPNIKSGNYLNNIMALGEARTRGSFDALMVNREGHVTEGTTWNIFIVKDETLITPPDEADILQGITRKKLKKICHDNGISLQERFFTVNELQKAEEAFSTGSVKEVLAIRSVDGQVIGDGHPGPITKKIAVLYQKFILDYCQKKGSRAGKRLR